CPQDLARARDLAFPRGLPRGQALDPGRWLHASRWNAWMFLLVCGRPDPHAARTRPDHDRNVQNHQLAPPRTAPPDTSRKHITERSGAWSIPRDAVAWTSLTAPTIVRV